jgi:predicted AAA+ superfamily ATPase
VDNTEVDFIASKANDKLYVQVTESMKSEDVRARELRPLQAIKDNYEKIILSLDTGLNTSYEGIKSLGLIEWLLSSK